MPGIQPLYPITSISKCMSPEFPRVRLDDRHAKILCTTLLVQYRRLLVERSHCQRRTDGRWALNSLRHRLVSHLSSAAPCLVLSRAHRFWQASHSNTEADLVAPDLRRIRATKCRSHKARPFETRNPRGKRGTSPKTGRRGRRVRTRRSSPARTSPRTIRTHFRTYRTIPTRPHASGQLGASGHLRSL